MQQFAISTTMPGLHFWWHLICFQKGHFISLLCSVNDWEAGPELMPSFLVSGQRTHSSHPSPAFLRLAESVAGRSVLRAHVLVHHQL